MSDESIALNPAVRILWRAPDAIQLELGGSAFVVTGVDSSLVAELTGRLAPPASGVPNDLARALATHRLAWSGARAQPSLAPSWSGLPSPRLGSELQSLTARLGGAALPLLRNRRQCTVEVIGRSRTGVHVATVLASAGIGRVYLTQSGHATLHQIGPGALDAGDEGRPLADAAADAITRAAPDTDTTPVSGERCPDLVVVAIDSPVPSDLRDTMHTLRQPYLCARVDAGLGVVGPLVVPGASSCLRCADLHRQDRDPAWTALAVQLSVAPRYGAPSEIALATTIAGLTAMQALTYLDGAEPPTIDGTLEIHLPDWRVRRRSWPPHPDCGCIV